MTRGFASIRFRLIFDPYEQCTIGGQRNILRIAAYVPFTKAFTGRTKTAKRSITESEIRKLHDLNLEEGSTLAMSRDIFIFSFYAMGMPFVDIAYLKKSQMKDNVIRYARHKTGQPISIALVPAMQAIISRYSSSDSIYVFRC